MPTIILLPDGAGATDSGWVTSSGATNECLDDNNGDTSYVACSTHNDEMIVTYANPSFDEATLESITSVQFLSSGRSTNRRSASIVTISFESPTAGFSENCSYNASLSYETINGTPRVYSNPSISVDWTYANLNNLEMKCKKFLGAQVRLSYLALLVTYVVKDVVETDSIFFGANF